MTPVSAFAGTAHSSAASAPASHILRFMTLHPFAPSDSGLSYIHGGARKENIYGEYSKALSGKHLIRQDTNCSRPVSLAQPVFRAWQSNPLATLSKAA